MKSYQATLNYLCHAGSLESAAVREAALTDLKTQGVSISDAIKGVREAAHVSLGQAKAWVSGSAAWGATARESEPLQEEARRLLADELSDMLPRAAA